MGDKERVPLHKQLEMCMKLKQYKIKVVDDDIHKLHCIFPGAYGTPYERGLYHLEITLPEGYPDHPPRYKCLNPSGRWVAGGNICMSISADHPESWNPSMGLAGIISGMQEYMTQAGRESGHVVTSDAQKRAFAEQSRSFK
ncbi:ubiquitin-conjugating enzyme E2 J2-like, partial [Aduncisulcus paluster]